MNYEEKYKQALERAKERYSACSAPALLEYIFPEIKGSEDEQIRKRLIKTFESMAKEQWGGIAIGDILAWLDKQGEQTHDEPEQSEVTVTPTCDNNKAFSQNSKNEYLGGTYMHGYRQAIDDVCEWIGKQHEMLEDCFSDVNDFADLVRETILKKGVGYE